MSRRAALAALPAALAVLVLTGCGGSDASEEAAPESNAIETRAPASPPVGFGVAATPSPSAVASPSPAGRVIDVRFAGGQVSGVESRVPATVGEQLVLRITSDVADEVHVHGYDKTADVPAGGTVEIPLTADIPGSFEVELHDLGKMLLQLRVS